MAFISVLLQIFWKKFYRNVSGVVLYQPYEFCPNRWFWLVTMTTKRLNFHTHKKKTLQTSASQKPYSLQSCTFRWALWPMGLWLHFQCIPSNLKICNKVHNLMNHKNWVTARHVKFACAIYIILCISLAGSGMATFLFNNQTGPAKLLKPILIMNMSV